MEKDDEVKGTGNHLDFGARGYDPRLGRWLSVDQMTDMYTPISPYAYSLNNPIFYIDADGNVVVDENGNEVYITPIKNEDGTYTATFEFAPNTSADAKQRFLVNGGKVINEMLKVPTGQEMVAEAVLSKEKIWVTVSERKVGDGAGLLLGRTRETSFALESNGTGLKVTVYEGSLEESAKIGLEGVKETSM